MILLRKSTNAAKVFEMRWATPEEFTEMKVMPRMLLDHFPDNILNTLSTLLEQQKGGSNGTIKVVDGEK